MILLIKWESRMLPGFFYSCGGFNTPMLCVVTKGIKADCNHLMRTTTPTLASGLLIFARALKLQNGQGCPCFHTEASLRSENLSSERPRMGGELIRSKFCVQNLSFTDIHGCMSVKSVHGCITAQQVICKSAGRAEGKQMSIC